MALAACPEAHGDRHDGRCCWCGSALGGRRRKYCSDRHQFLWRSNHVWAVARELALMLADGACEQCGTIEDLEVHHLQPTNTYGWSCAHHQTNLRVLCVAHHLDAHAALSAKPGTVTQLRLGIAA